MKNNKIDFLNNLPYAKKLYSIWKGMIYRCSHNFKGYGAKGIEVCDEWKNNFMNFYKWSIENGYKYEPKPLSANKEKFRNNLTLDRIDGNGNYEPSNCRWVDMKTQNNNKIRVFKSKAKKCQKCPLFRIACSDVALDEDEIANILYNLNVKITKAR